MFVERGYQFERALLSQEECKALAVHLKDIGDDAAGTRNLLQEGWCKRLAAQIQSNAQISRLLPNKSVAVQCTYFEKSPEKNWLVAVHQDLSIPVEGRIDHPELRNWGMKEGSMYVQPPVSLLEKLVAVRVHIDPCSTDDGPLRVVPESHRVGIVKAEDAPAIRERLGEVVCAAQPGDALIMSPLLLHASSKGRGVSRRRVLHFLFGPSELPFGLQWSLA
jgi:ectoine hydroxylase-related dioxygenase (phytanoyl-CoA dioxygenase family)